jgi:23S rRNA (guanine745-N1)-methyltransferase
VRAATRHVGVDYAVADAYALPVQTDSVALMLNILGPVVPAEVERVLHPAGVIVAVAPGPRHLLEVRRLLVDDPIERPLRGPVGFEEHFERYDLARITFAMLLPPGDFADLVQMTPYSRQIGLPEVVDRQVDERVTADLVIGTYRQRRS